VRLVFDPTRSTRRVATATDAAASAPGTVEDDWFWCGPAARAEVGGWPRALDALWSDDDRMAPAPAREAAPPLPVPSWPEPAREAAPQPDEPPVPAPPPDLGGLELPSDDLLPGG